MFEGEKTDILKEENLMEENFTEEVRAEAQPKHRRKKVKKGRYILLGMLLVFLPVAAVFLAGGWFLYSHHLSLTVATENSIQNTAKLNIIKALIDQYYLFDYDKENLGDGSLKGLVAGLGDPYSTYYNKEEYEKLKESNTGTYYGIGVLMNQNMNTGVITAVQVFSDSPALEAGIRPGDLLLAIEGEEITGMDLNNVVSKIKGSEGSTVQITVQHEGDKEVTVLDVERRKVDVDTVSHKMLENKIGYINLVEFEAVSTDQFTKALEDLKSQGMKSLVLDLRNNPGGLLDTAVNLADIFIDTGVVISTEDAQGNKKDYSATKEGALDIPFVVLVNENSASASEVLSGCLKHYCDVTLVGKKTFGKGIVQNIIPLTDGSALKLTVAHYYLPDGTDIHKQGITPDIVIEDDPETEVDEQLQKGIEILRKES